MSGIHAAGRVLTDQGWAVPGATLTALGTDGRQVGRTVADGDGSFAIDGLEPGPVTVLVAAAAHEPKALSMVVPRSSPWHIGDVRIARQGGGSTPPPGIWAIDAAHSSVQVRARHFGLGGVSGRFEDFGGMIVVDETFARSHVDVRITAASISTANADRDAHLRSRDFLDVDRYPTLRYTSQAVERFADEWRVRGELTLLATTRPVDLAVSYLGSGPDPWGGTRAGFSATAELRRADFALDWNQAIDIGVNAVGTTLQVSIDVEAVLQS